MVSEEQTHPLIESNIPMPERPALGARSNEELDKFYSLMKIGDSIWCGTDRNKQARVIARIKKVHGKGSAAARKVSGNIGGPNGEEGVRVWRIEPPKSE